MDIYFVILHYQTVQETFSCVESILNLYSNISIVIVDNHSPNNSGAVLLEKYKNYSNVTVFITEENLGFAQGNNIGYKYAKSQGADFIIQVNNDTIFDDENFISTLECLYEKEKYAVLGPDVICMKDGRHQNPLKGFKVSKKSVFWRIIKNVIAYHLAAINIDIKLKQETVYQSDWDECIDINLNEDKVLQGCCYIFSPIYIKAFEGMFEGTFMYYEEYILDYMCRKKGLKMIYSPELSLKHLRKAATSSAVLQEKAKRRFKYKHSVNSLKAFYRECL